MTPSGGAALEHAGDSRCTKGVRIRTGFRLALLDAVPLLAIGLAASSAEAARPK
jgi:hypothetical protein